MTPPTLALLTVLAAASLAGHLRAEYHGPRWQIYVFKPLTTGLLLGAASLGQSAASPRYQAGVVVGMAFSLVGDIWLMLPGDRFVPGLASFLAAHLAYLVAFTTGVPLGSVPALGIPIAGVAALLLWLLWPSLGRLRWPVMLYAAVLGAMTWQALSRAGVLRTRGSMLAATGAALFLVSDAALAMRRFRGSFRLDHAVVMLTYVAAQALIVWSTAAR
jgi:uncharacterized membrane protein YhhN